MAFFHSLIANRSIASDKPRRLRRRPLRIEPLEHRQMLAGDLGFTDDLAVLSDEFDDPAAIVDWQRVNETEGWNADQLQVWNVDQTQPGRMVMQPHTVVWYENWRGPMAFKEVTGDFIFTSEIVLSDRDDVGNSDADDVPDDATFSLGGIMIRTPRPISNPATEWSPGSRQDDGINNGENYVFLSMGHGTDGQFSFEVKTTRNSRSQLELTPLGQEANTTTLRIARVGNSVITMYRLPGEEWTVHRRYSRPDMPETMQLGLVTYTDWNKASDFDPFVHNSTVLQAGINDPTPNEPFNPDLVAGFEYARFARPQLPAELSGVNLVNAATDEQLLSFLGDANVTVANEPPQIEPIADQSVVVGSEPLVVELSAVDADGDSLSYEAQVVGSLASQIMAEHNLYEMSWRDDYALNWGGHNEKWLQGDQGWYYLLPDGTLNLWSGNFESSTLLAELTIAEHDNPNRLLQAIDPDISAEVVDGQLVVTPGNQTGLFDIQVMVSDGAATDSTTFSVEVTDLVAVANTAPQIDPIANQTTVVGSDPLVIDLVATDADSNSLTFEVSVEGSLAAQIMAEHNLYEMSSRDDYALNWGGQNEKWLQGDQGWYYLLPDGTLNLWSGSFESSTLLAELSVAEYDNPDRLLQSTHPDISAEIVNGQLVITPGSQTGSFQIQVAVSDAVASDITSFNVEVTNTAPSLILADQTVTSGQTLNIQVPTVDVDGHPITYTVEVLGDQLSTLDSEHGFWSDGNYYTNYHGQNERWIRDAANRWHYLLPNGELYRWEGSFEASQLIANVGNAVYEDPARLTDPQPVPVVGTVENGLLTITTGEDYIGDVTIRVTTSDGITTMTTTFQIFVVLDEDMVSGTS